MRALLISAVLLGCAFAQQEEFDEQQQVQQFPKNIKGGGYNWEPYNPSSADLVRVFNNRQSGQSQYNSQGQYNSGQSQYNYGQSQYNSGQGQYNRVNLTNESPDLNVGVCYIEVPTASLVRGGQVPTGNGSAPHLSRIRGCCKGYIRNIHNFRKCDPVCTQECVNALCTAPETCTCFPDHVKNLAGFCIPTCPIGCQNGYCSGGECLCNQGYKLDRDSKFCIPLCKENCGGIGNCTAPNTCECKQGYQTSKEGSCKPVCDKCTNGDCVAPNECRCHQGFSKDQHGLCAPKCQPGYQPSPQGCKPVCNQCTHGECVGPNQCNCHQGYTKNQQGICMPHCSPDCGPTSRCVSPNVCDPPVQHNQPNPYQPNGQYQPSPYQPSNPLYPDSQVVPSGVPQCSQPCLNGVCAGENRCSCNPGYVADSSDQFKCLPNCPGGCPNGVCSAPNFCICNLGYVKDHSVKGRPTCVKRNKRSIDDNEYEKHPTNVADLLIFDIPDY